MAEATTQARTPTLADRIVAATPGDCRLEMCIQCGTCGGSCPSGANMEHTPRALFALINAGMEEQVLSSNTPWYCVSCYYCTVRCPQEIHITDLMYTIKRLSIQEGKYRKSTASDAPGFSQDFIFFVENFGRSFELGIAAAYNLRYHPLGLPKMAPMAFGMVRKNRMGFLPTRIKGIAGLKAILAKAKGLEGQI
jgi:heterodisulfide reductase subunit C